MGIVLLLDNDVAIRIFDTLYRTNKLHFKQTLAHLGTSYNQIWVPKEVENEFFNCTQVKKRKKILKKIYSDFQFIKKCPVKVSKKEIDLDNNFSDADKGETEAILQGMKAKSSDKGYLNFSDILLFSNDKVAMNRAELKSINVLKYKDFALKMREVGLILP